MFWLVLPLRRSELSLSDLSEKTELMQKSSILRKITILGALIGFGVTRFLEDRNLLITNIIVIVCALTFRFLAIISFWLSKKVKAKIEN